MNTKVIQRNHPDPPTVSHNNDHDHDHDHNNDHECNDDDLDYTNDGCYLADEDDDEYTNEEGEELESPVKATMKKKGGLLSSLMPAQVE